MPPELLSRIFSYLLGQRDDIGACRQVCHSFKELSSLFLITYVVLARRLKTLKHLREVTEHSYFSRHVTELVWDASAYYPPWALNRDDYLAQCKRVQARFASQEVVGWKTRETTEWDNLEEWARLPDGDPAAWQAGQGTEVFLLPSTRASDLLHPDEQQKLDAEVERHSLDVETGFAEYRQLLLAQKRIDDSGVIKRVLAQTFAKMPKLRSVRITDFRSLAKESVKATMLAADASLARRLNQMTLARTRTSPTISVSWQNPRRVGGSSR